MNGDEEMLQLGRTMLLEMLRKTKDKEFLICVGETKVRMLHYNTDDKELLAKRIEDMLLKFVPWKKSESTQKK